MLLERFSIGFGCGGAGAGYATELSRAETQVHGLVERADGSFELTGLSG